MKMRTRPHWSFSALNQYLRCPLQYYFERVLRIPRKSVGSGLIFGSAVHNALAVYHQSLQRGEDPDWQQIQQEYLETWLFREDEQTVEYKPKESRDDLIAQGLELLKLYCEEPPPQEIVSVEHRCYIPLSNSEGDYLVTPLIAIADLVTREIEGCLKITEFKTSGRAYGEFEVEKSLQATCYVNMLWEGFGEWASVEFTVLVKTKTPKIQRLKTARNEDDIGRLGDLVETVERAVENEIFYPIETPVNCSMCAFRKECREWKPRKTVTEQNPELVELNGVEVC
ncbi:PD-(D/E)XK nuclease superfamily protein [Gimesia panareensis]|uniref:PD-(D/E)XK nuclease superfamily protein n=1 Tax=Gimesia panareensis TaxID=2527978 RepID=A0A517QE42_9PLAN|nr:PD-(D/E)XK nuclease family protein [Gimesia panareensis]QDT29901.1 PD-(D/E)XK nuclease superfamily protein [Gimesia panareensis]